MKTVKLLIVALILLASTAAFAGTQTTEYLTYESVQRYYIKYVPSGFSGDRPMVLCLHGGGGNAYDQANVKQSKELKTVADSEGFIVVYPDSNDAGWKDCRSESGVGSEGWGQDAVGFINAVVDDADSESSVDLARVYLTGSSNGGMMTLRMAFDSPDKFAAFATCSAQIFVDPYCDCPANPPYPVAIAQINGTADPAMPPEGGYVLDEPNRGAVISQADQVDFWVDFLNTDTSPSTYQFPDIDTSDAGVVNRHTYANGDNDTQFIWYEEIDAGHTMPSDTVIAPPEQEAEAGPQNHDVETAELWWANLEGFRRGGATNNSPDFTSEEITKARVIQGSSYTGQTLSGSASDPDSDTLTYSKGSGPSWLSIATSGALSGTPGSGDVGINPVKAVVSDGNGGYGSANLYIHVNNASADHFANSYTPVTGSWARGKFWSASKDDNNYLAMTSNSSSTKVMECQYDFSGCNSSPSSINISVTQMPSVNITTNKIYVWNYNSSSWYDTGTFSTTKNTESTRNVTISTNPSYYVSGGAMKIKMYSSKSALVPYTIFTDYVKVSTN